MADLEEAFARLHSAEVRGESQTLDVGHVRALARHLDELAKLRPTARRIAEEYRRRDSQATAAYREWEAKQTLSAAVVRDDTAKRRDAMEDAGTLAQAVLDLINA